METKCKICCNLFKKNDRSHVCSLKCRVLEGIVRKNNGCWIWIKLKAGDYGKLRWKSKTISAHRASYTAFIGQVPSGLHVCHKCDDPLCVNPEHLWLGTPKENKLDAKRKNRIPLGTKNHFHKFSDEQTEEMRKLKSEGFTYDRLKRIFNCSTIHIYNVVKNKSR